MSSWHRIPRLVTVIAAGLLSVPGCTQELSREPVGKPMLAGLQGGGGFRALQNPDEDGQPGGIPAGSPRRETAEDGTVTLRSPTVADLMRHILETIAGDEEDLFTEQVLSSVTKSEFVERGFDPKEAFRELARRQDDVRALFRAMPVGEYTPGVMMRQVGRNTFRLGVKGDPGLRWSFMDVVLERGRYTLRWFGQE
jgi:hypothetical protein